MRYATSKSIREKKNRDFGHNINWKGESLSTNLSAKRNKNLVISMGPKVLVFGRFARASNKTKIRQLELLQTYVLKMSEKCHTVDSVHYNSCR